MFIIQILRVYTILDVSEGYENLNEQLSNPPNTHYILLNTKKIT